MQMEFARVHRVSFLVASSLLAACGGAGTKPEWSQVIHTESPVVVTEADSISYRYPEARSVMPDVVPYQTGYGIPLGLEDADHKLLGKLVNLDKSGQITDSFGFYTPAVPLFKSASGGLVRDVGGWVLAFSGNQGVRWEKQQILGGEVTNTSGNAADFTSALVSYQYDGSTSDWNKVLIITGLSAVGDIVWQQSYVHSASNNFEWIYAHDDQGQLCFLAPANEIQEIRCLNPDGTVGFRQASHQVMAEKMDVSNQEVAVIGRSGGSYQVELFARSAGLLQTAQYPDNAGSNRIVDTEFSSDGQFHVSIEASGAISLLSLDGAGGETLTEISRNPHYADPVPTLFTLEIGALSADARGNVYIAGEAWGEVASGDTRYTTVRSVIKKRDLLGNVSDVVLGHVSKYRYMQNNACIKRCDGFSGAKVLTDIVAQPDGRLITAWAESTVNMSEGDLGTGGLVPFRKAVTVASYAPDVVSKP